MAPHKAKGRHFHIAVDKRRHEVRGVPFTVKHVVCSAWFRHKVLSRGPAALRTFVTAQNLYTKGEGDVLVLFVELFEGEEEGKIHPHILAAVHESDADSPSMRWTAAEQAAAQEELTNLTFNQPAGTKLRGELLAPEYAAAAERDPLAHPSRDEAAAAFRARDRWKAVALDVRRVVPVTMRGLVFTVKLCTVPRRDAMALRQEGDAGLSALLAAHELCKPDEGNVIVVVVGHGPDGKVKPKDTRALLVASPLRSDSPQAAWSEEEQEAALREALSAAGFGSVGEIEETNASRIDD